MRKLKVREEGFSPRNAAVCQHGWDSDLDVSYSKAFMLSVSGFSLWGLLWETPPTVLSSSCGDRNDIHVHTHIDAQTLSVEMSIPWVSGRATAPELFDKHSSEIENYKHTSGRTEGEIRRMKEIPTSNWATGTPCSLMPLVLRVDWGWGNN